MLSFVSRFGSGKGTVLVPDLSGLTLAQATAAIQNAGLTYGGNTAETTGTSSLNGLVKNNSQSITVGTRVDYETAISFVLYSYVYVPPAVTLVSTSDSGCKDGTATTKSTCSGYTETVTTTTPRSGTITKTYSDGTTSVSSYDCTSTVSSIDVQNSTTCGYPVKTCTASVTTTTSACSGGYKTRVRTVIDVDCSKTSTISEICCSTTSTTYSAWSSCVCGGRSRTVTTTTTCGGSSSSSSSVETGPCTGGQTYCV